MNQSNNQLINQSINTAIAVPFVTADTIAETVAHYSSIHTSHRHHDNKSINQSDNQSSNQSNSHPNNQSNNQSINSSSNQSNDPPLNQSCDLCQIDDGSGVLIDLAINQIPKTGFITSVDTIQPPPPIDQSINQVTNQLINQSLVLNSFSFPVYPSESNRVIGYRLIEKIVPLNAMMTVMGVVSINQSDNQTNSQSNNGSVSQSINQTSNQSNNQSINQSINQSMRLMISPPPVSDPRPFLVAIEDVAGLLQARLNQADCLFSASYVSAVVGVASLGWWWINRR